MDLILCHQTADFDVLGAAVGLSRLYPGSRIVLTGGAHPGVRNFLALYRDEFPLLELRSVHPQQLRRLWVVDNQRRDRLGKAAPWLDLPQLEAIAVYDHHPAGSGDIPATEYRLETLGAITSYVVERLQGEGVSLNRWEATVMALGIHVDTGSLTFGETTPRDARALAWLLEQGAHVPTIAEYVEPALSPELQDFLTQALQRMHWEDIQGQRLGSVLLQSESFMPGLSNLVEQLMDLTDGGAILVGHQYGHRATGREEDRRLVIIGRSKIPGTDLNALFAPYGGGGHRAAASVNLRQEQPEQWLGQLVRALGRQIPHAPTARDLMSSPVRTILPQTTIEAAERILFRYGHSGLSVVDEQGKLQGVISRRDLDLAIHHGFPHAPVKGYMARDVRTIAPHTSLKEIEEIMVTYDVGRLPVLAGDQLVGIVTRTDVLRQLHQEQRQGHRSPETACFLPNLWGEGGAPRCDLPQETLALATPWQKLLQIAAQEAADRGWHLYLVGGAVRDVLLGQGDRGLLDVDLVVDGFHRATDGEAGVILAQCLQQHYPQARLSVHGAFQTAALLWHQDPEFGSLWVDIATARTEFYPYPAANPEVEASSIRQDLYRRDFTINALAVRLTPPGAGAVLDFFGGVEDLRCQRLRVLHANSFIEDPTRIYRAVRFVVRLGFHLDRQTEDYIRYALESGVYERHRHGDQPVPALTTRLRSELRYLLQAPYWGQALEQLHHLGALGCLHRDLRLTPSLRRQLRWLDRLLPFVSGGEVEPWLLRLELLLTSLPQGDRRTVAQNLHLPKDSIDRLDQWDDRQAQIAQHPPQTLPLSQWVAICRPLSWGMLLLLTVQSDPPLRAYLLRYLGQWSAIGAPLTGEDLKALGYKPGPQFKTMLADLLAARLDGQLAGDRATAFAYLQHHYPPPEPIAKPIEKPKKEKM